MKIIIINGVSKSGKDKFVDIFNNISKYRIRNLSSIDKIKSIAEICFNWNGKKNNKSRKFLSNMKKAWSDYNNGPTDYIINKIDIDTKYCIEQNKNINNNVYFIHIREPHEIDKIINIYGNICTTLLIKKDISIIPDNYSDKNVNNYKYNYTISNNNDIKHLEEEAEKFNDFLTKKYKISRKT